MSRSSQPKKTTSIARSSDSPVSNPTVAFDPEGPNSHLANYIEYYKRLERPGYAVLVTGEWGTGKTHLMRQLLPWEGGDKQSYYVSLFGLKSAAEVDAAVYAEMYPSHSAMQEGLKEMGDAARGVAVLGFSAGGLIGGGANLVSAFMRKEIDTSKPIIFDDLERSSMATTEEKLGVINYYVEHKHCRVIVIAHDEKLVDAIIEAKEKIFGQTIRIEPDAKSAFEKFITEIANGQIAALIGQLERVIVGVFTQSGAKSLRILRHVIFDLERFFATLEKRHVENQSAMQDIVPLFVAVAIGTRSNFLDAESIRNRHGASRRRSLQIYVESRRGNEEIKPSKLEFAQNLYTGIDLENQVLNDNVLIDMLVRGRYDKQDICASLDNSTYFAKTRSLPPWRKIVEFEKLPDSVVEEAATAMEQQFATRAVTEIGEMLHIFTLRMMMAKHGMLERTSAEVVDESKAYIDDLLSQGRLPATYKGGFDDVIRMSGSHGGYGFWVEDSYQEFFKNVVAHLRAQCKIAQERTYPAIAKQLLDMLVTQPREFAGAISYLPDGSHQFADLPVMNAILVEEFVKVWLNAPNRGDVWYWMRIGLEQRYQGPALSPGTGPLASEAEWVGAVLAEMRSCAEAEAGFRRFRIERAIPKVQLHNA